MRATVFERAGSSWVETEQRDALPDEPTTELAGRRYEGDPESDLAGERAGAVRRFARRGRMFWR